jgi:hypothetical protein
MPNTIYDFYQLNDTDQPVYLEVTIGYAQSGTTTACLRKGDVCVAKTDSFYLTVGTNKELQREELRIESLVTDVQKDFNVCSATYILSGGSETKSWVLHQQSEDHKTYPFLAVFGLFR